jgi:hypothetical protein
MKKILQYILCNWFRRIFGVRDMQAIKATLLPVPEPATISETLEFLCKVVSIEVRTGAKGPVEFVEMGANSSITKATESIGGDHLCIGLVAGIL